MWNVYSTGTAVPATLYIAVSSLASVAKWGNSGWKVGDRRSCSLERAHTDSKRITLFKRQCLKQCSLRVQISESNPCCTKKQSTTRV